MKHSREAVWCCAVCLLSAPSGIHTFLTLYSEHFRDAAQYLSERLQTPADNQPVNPDAKGCSPGDEGGSFKGVCYFDPAERSWMVLEPSGRCLPRLTSPVPEREAFVMFDEARCRGADLQVWRVKI